MLFFEPHRRPDCLTHNPFKALITPRPIAWVSTLSIDRIANLAPYSFFNIIADNPPMVMLSIGGTHVEGGLKDSLANIQARRELVIHLATYDLREKIVLSSAPVGRKIDEFDLCGLEKLPSQLVQPYRVKGSPVQLECVLHDIIPLPATDPTNAYQLILAKVIGFHIDESLIHDGKVDISRAKPLARLGYQDYCSIETVFSLSPAKAP